MYLWEDVSGFSIRDRARSFTYAANGLKLVLRGQHNAWIHAVLTIAAVVLGFALGISALEWCAIVLAIALVWAGEAFNTSLEALADASVPEQHPKIAEAKDAAAGAVLVCAIAAAIVGIVVFGPRLVAWVSG